MAAPALFAGAVDVHRGPEVGWLGRGEVKRGREHTDDRIRSAVEGNRLAQNVPASAVLFLPGGIAQHHGSGSARQLLVITKVAAKRGSDAESAEEASGYARALCGLRTARRVQDETGVAISVERSENGVELLPVDVVEIGKIAERKEGNAFEDAHQPRGILIGERFEQGRIDESENGDAGAHAQRQHQSSRASEAGSLSQLPDAEAKIVPQVIEQIPSPHIATLLFPLFQAVNRTQGGAARFLARHAGADVLVDLPVHVIMQFLVELLFHGRPRYEGTKPNPKNVDPTHANALHQAVRTIIDIAAAKRSHWAASWSSALRPALVSV